MTDVNHVDLPFAFEIIPRVLGQSVDGGMDVCFGVFLLVVLLVGGFYGVNYVKKWLKEEDEPNSGIGFTLGDLRRLHQEGHLTDEEFEKARGQMIAATQRAAERAAIKAAEDAKKSGGVTDIEELRDRARRREE